MTNELSVNATNLKQRLDKAVKEDSVIVISGKKQIVVKFWKNSILYKVFPNYVVPPMYMLEEAIKEFSPTSGKIGYTSTYFIVSFSSVMEQTAFLTAIGYDVFGKNAEKEAAKKERQAQLKAGKLTWQRFIKKVQEECPPSENWYRGEGSFGNEIEEGFIEVRNSGGRTKRYMFSEFIDREAFRKSWYHLSREYRWYANS